MSQVQLNSNANSALQNTLAASQSMVNPNVYSTMPIYPASSLGFFKIEKSSGSVGSSAQISYNIPKYGILEQVLMSFSKTYATAGNRAVQQSEIYAAIDRVELLSSSRVVSTLTSADLLAQLSDLEASQMGAVQNGGVSQRGASSTPTDPRTMDYTLPIVFGFFEQLNTQLNSSFLEPMSIRITWGDLSRISADGPAPTGGDNPHIDPTDPSFTEPVLVLRYKNYDEAVNAEMLAANYDAPELNIVSTRWYDESPVVFTQPATPATTAEFTMQLKNTDCVESFYLMVRQMTANGGAKACAPVFCNITEISFFGSGQEILTLTGQELAYAKITEDGWSTSSGSAENIFADKVKKIQMGCYGYGKLSNSLSLREINNPTLVVKAQLNTTAGSQGGITGTVYQLDCCEKCVAIYSTSSATGRQNLALSN